MTDSIDYIDDETQLAIIDIAEQAKKMKGYIDALLGEQLIDNIYNIIASIDSKAQFGKSRELGGSHSIVNKKVIRGMAQMASKAMHIKSDMHILIACEPEANTYKMLMCRMKYDIIDKCKYNGLFEDVLEKYIYAYIFVFRTKILVDKYEREAGYDIFGSILGIGYLDVKKNDVLVKLADELILEYAGMCKSDNNTKALPQVRRKFGEAGIPLDDVNDISLDILNDILRKKFIASNPNEIKMISFSIGSKHYDCSNKHKLFTIFIEALIKCGVSYEMIQRDLGYSSIRIEKNDKFLKQVYPIGDGWYIGDTFNTRDLFSFIVKALQYIEQYLTVRISFEAVEYTGQTKEEMKISAQRKKYDNIPVEFIGLVYYDDHVLGSCRYW